MEVVQSIEGKVLALTEDGILSVRNEGVLSVRKEGVLFVKVICKEGRGVICKGYM